ncbi:MAG: histidine kinase dimerization/phospho-acceptor domain-containing protein, partial [Clostridia bacterium]|nr:histidine kinase dimerization/phospho-acceptor domain-containing protein [Clostridia bacterium]
TLAYAQSPTKSLPADERDITIALVRGLEEQISTAGYKAVVLCGDAEGCIQAVESGKADVAAADRASLEYYIYESGSSLVTSLIPGQTQNTDIAVSRACDTALLAAMNNDIYSISEEDLAAYLSTGNLHSDRFSLAAFTRRHPVQAAVIVASATAILAAVIFILLSRSAKERSAMQALHNTQLQAALSIDRETNAAKTTFLSNMSHDIRTPMNAVVGLTHLALEEDLGTIRSYLDKIDASSDFLLGLINDVLDMSKIESGKMSLRQSVFSIDELMESINVIIRPMAGEKRQSSRSPWGICPTSSSWGGQKPAQPGAHQSAVQRHQIHPHWRVGLPRHGGAPGGGGGEPSPLHRPGDRRGHERGLLGSSLCPLLPGAFPTQRQHQGHRPGAPHRQESHRRHGRHHRRGEPSGARDHLYRGSHRPPGRAGDGGRSPAAPGGGATLGASASPGGGQRDQHLCGQAHPGRGGLCGHHGGKRAGCPGAV